MTKETPSFSVPKYDQEAFYKILETLEKLGAPGHERLEIVQQADQTYSLKTTKKVSWMRWIFERIFGKNKNLLLKNVAEVAYAIFERNVDYLPEKISRARQFHLLFNKLKGPEGEKLKIKFDKLLSNNNLFQIAKNNELKNAYKEAEAIRRNTEIKIKEIEEQSLIEAKKILEDAKIYKNDLESERRDLFKPVFTQLKTLRDTYDLAELNNQSLASAERAGQAEKNRIIKSANKESKKLIKKAENTQKKFLESIPKVIGNLKNSAVHDYAISCHNGEIVTCSKFALEDFPFFSNDTKKQMDLLSQPLQVYKDQHPEVKTCLDLSQLSFATKENMERLITLGKELSSDDWVYKDLDEVADIIEKLVSPKANLDEFMNFVRFIDYINHSTLLEGCAYLFEKILTFENVVEYIQRDLNPSEEIFDYPEAFTERMLKMLRINFFDEFEIVLFLYKSKKLSNRQFGEILSHRSLFLNNVQWLEVVVNLDGQFINECQIFKEKLLQLLSENFENRFEIIQRLYADQKITDRDLLQILKDNNLKISENNLLGFLKKLGIDQAKLYQGQEGERLVDHIRFELLGSAGFEMYKDLLSADDLIKWSKIYKGEIKLDQIRPHRIADSTAMVIGDELRCYFILSKSHNPIAKHFQFSLPGNSTLQFFVSFPNTRNFTIGSNLNGLRHFSVKANCKDIYSQDIYAPRVKLSENDSLIDEELIEIKISKAKQNRAINVW